MCVLKGRKSWFGGKTSTLQFQNELIFNASGSISSIDFSKDAECVVVGTQCGSLDIWSIVSKNCVKRIETLDAQINCIAFLPEIFTFSSQERKNDALTVGTNNSLRIYNFKELTLRGDWPLFSKVLSVGTSKTLEEDVVLSWEVILATYQAWTSRILHGLTLWKRGANIRLEVR